MVGFLNSKQTTCNELNAFPLVLCNLWGIILQNLSAVRRLGHAALTAGSAGIAAAQTSQGTQQVWHWQGQGCPDAIPVGVTQMGQRQSSCSGASCGFPTILLAGRPALVWRFALRRGSWVMSQMGPKVGVNKCWLRFSCSLNM